MSKPARGSKRVCQSCGARFYDLSRTPIVCPSCQAVYQVTQPTSRRGERAPVPEVREKVEPEVEAVALEPETISLEEVEEAGEDVVVEDEEIVDLGEDEAEIPAAGDDDTFLEEPEGDEEADVSGIVRSWAGRGRLDRVESRKPGAPVSTAPFAFLLNADQDRPNSSAPEPTTRCWLPAVRFSSSDRGHSSVGRAREWHSRGRRFDPAWLHQFPKNITQGRFAITVVERPAFAAPHRDCVAASSASDRGGASRNNRSAAHNTDGRRSDRGRTNSRPFRRAKRPW